MTGLSRYRNPPFEEGSICEKGIQLKLTLVKTRLSRLHDDAVLKELQEHSRGVRRDLDYYYSMQLELAGRFEPCGFEAGEERDDQFTVWNLKGRKVGFTRTAEKNVFGNRSKRPLRLILENHPDRTKTLLEPVSCRIDEEDLVGFLNEVLPEVWQSG
jgi:hypothetical protein